MEEDDLRSAARMGTWLKSSRSVCSCLKASGLFHHLVAIGDTKYSRFEVGPPADEPIVIIASTQWDAFLATIRAAGLDANDPAETGLDVQLGSDGDLTLSSVEDGTTLWFDREEVAAFVEGVKDGELTSSSLFFIAATKAHS